MLPWRDARRHGLTSLDFDDVGHPRLDRRLRLQQHADPRPARTLVNAMLDHGLAAAAAAAPT